MSYTFPITAHAMFEDRFEQFVALGLPRTEVEEMRSAITDMWSDAPGGWVFEWSRLARRHLETQQPYMAAVAYGWAKFPCLANDARRRALADQVTAYLTAARDFPVKFERRIVATPFAGGTAALPVHLYSVSGLYHQEPILLVSGGVDTWKMDIHRMCVECAQRLGVTVLAFDQPGTGENPAPLVLEADEIVLGLARQARNIGNGRVAHFGLSFGANYSAMTGLRGVVDASVVLGGPIDRAFAKDALEKLPYGMADIVSNAIGFERQPTKLEFVNAAAKLSRRALLEQSDNAPMLVINGENDYFVPQSDTRIFEDRPKTEVHLIAEAGHCARSKLRDVMSMVLRWLPEQIGGDHGEGQRCPL
jgi:esterase FrsA